MPSYEELVGGLGRAVAYRAERHLVREFISDAAATLVSAGQQYALYDIAMNGISLDVPLDDPEWTQAKEVTATLMIHDSPVYRGPLKVARIERLNARRKRIGLQLLRGFIDLPEIRRQDEQASLTRALDGGPDPVRDLIPPAYREAMERAAFFLQFYRQALDAQAARFAEMGADGADAISSMTRNALRALRQRWLAIRLAAAEAAMPALDEPDLRRAMKRYTETLVTPLLLCAPVLQRAFDKPLGYPGDYQTMLYIYRNELEGATAFGQVLHKLSVEEPLAAGVRGRRDFLRELTTEEHRRFIARGDRGGEPFHVASLGAGPAREVVDFVEEHRSWPGEIQWTLIDQEEETLSLAYHSLYRSIAEHNAPGKVRCVYVSFKQILGDAESILRNEPQDLLYVAGIFDYLGKARAKKLIQFLFSFLAPGGLLAIGNAIGPTKHFWTTEMGLDWSLIYRTRKEMEALAPESDQVADVQIVAEPANAYWFLLVRKKL